MAALNVDDIGAQIQAGLGMIGVDDVKASEVIAVTLIVDDSYSIKAEGNEQFIRDGVNSVFEALGESKQKDGILVHVSYLNGRQFPFCALKDAVKLDVHNYQATGGTPLFDQQLVVLGRVVAKTQEFADNGVPVRSVTFTFTDGADSGSRKRPQDINPVVRDMLRQETHIIGAMGIDDGVTDYTKVFTSMGMDPQWILTPKNSKSEIRKAFMVASQSALRASQAGGGFSAAATGGFGAGTP